MWKNQGNVELWQMECNVQTYYISHLLFIEYAALLFSINEVDIFVLFSYDFSEINNTDLKKGLIYKPHLNSS